MKKFVSNEGVKKVYQQKIVFIAIGSSSLQYVADRHRLRFAAPMLSRVKWAMRKLFVVFVIVVVVVDIVIS